jgi:hypothetical protein
LLWEEDRRRFAELLRAISLIEELWPHFISLFQHLVLFKLSSTSLATFVKHEVSYKNTWLSVVFLKQVFEVSSSLERDSLE